MPTARDFSFGDNDTAHGYDSVLVPLMFDPWADDLISRSDAWEGCTVLDLAAGTGIVAEKLSAAVGPQGRVVAADINPEMLDRARARNAAATNIEYRVSPAEPLDIESDSVDVVVCQQGFQFFPNKEEAANEIYRVLHNGGTTMISTWCPVEECVLFQLMANALAEVGETELSELIRVPFDHMPATILHDTFDAAGFADVVVEKIERPISLPEGPEQVVTLMHASPIGIKIRALDPERRSDLERRYVAAVTEMSSDGHDMGVLTSHMLTARRL